jgi:hypothetical protein
LSEFLEAFGNAIGATVGWLADTGVLFLLFALIWLAFGIAIVRSQGAIDQTWKRLRALPLAVQVIAWLLLLPVMLGLAIWEARWPVAVRAVLVLALAAWNLVIFLP